MKAIAVENGVAVDSQVYIYSRQDELCIDVFNYFYIDVNNNCIKDNDELFASVPVAVELSTLVNPPDTFHCLNGFKSLVSTIYEEDIITCKVLSMPVGTYLTCPSDSTIRDTMLLNVTEVFNNYFGINCTSGNAFDLSVNANTPVTGAIDQWGTIFTLNTHCYGPNTILTFQHSPKYEYTGDATPQPTSVNGTVLTWNLGSLAFGGMEEIHFQVWTPGGPLTFGDTVQNRFFINPNTGDIDPTNNAIVVVDTVVASCDPNAIYVNPGFCTIPGGELEYTITFENMGNGPAEHVFILDTLPAELDIKTLEIEFNSHYMTYARRVANGQNIIMFDFPDINLADSSDHENCHGMFKYTIKSYNTLPIGTEINHRAGIYFDYNGVILTNTVKNEICAPAVIEEIISKNDLTVYPNPVSDVLSITSSKGKVYEITNMLGQLMLSGCLEAGVGKVDINAISPGIYSIKVAGDKTVSLQKFQKL